MMLSLHWLFLFVTVTHATMCVVTFPRTKVTSRLFLIRRLEDGEIITEYEEDYETLPEVVTHKHVLDEYNAKKKQTTMLGDVLEDDEDDEDDEDEDKEHDEDKEENLTEEEKTGEIEFVHT